MGHQVHGEIYEVNDESLKQLDILEDHPNFYVREKNEVITCDDNKSSEVWIYFLKKFKPELLSKQMFETYNSKGSHGLVYMERYRRDSNYDHVSEVVSKDN